MDINENGGEHGKTHCMLGVLTLAESRERSSLCDFFDVNNTSDLNSVDPNLITASFDLRVFKDFFLNLYRVSLLISFSDKVNG